MTRLLVHVEGETEEMFVNEVLAPHLYRRGFSRVAARLLGSAVSDAVVPQTAALHSRMCAKEGLRMFDAT